MKLTTSDGLGSRAATFAELESLIRVHAQAFIQRVLEDEVNELLGRMKSERRAEGSSAGYRNGYGEERRLPGPALGH